MTVKISEGVEVEDIVSLVGIPVPLKSLTRFWR